MMMIYCNILLLLIWNSCKYTEVSIALKKNLVVTYTKCSCRAIKQISNKFHNYKGSNNHNNLFGEFCRHGIKIWEGEPNLFNFQSISILTIRCTRRQKQFLCLNIVLHNKTGPLFLKFNRCEKSFSFIMKIAHSVDVASLKLRALMSRTTTSAYVKVQW